MNLLEVRGLMVAFGSGADAPRAVDDLSFAIGEGERVALVGESGSGKSVTGLAILGLLDPPGRVIGGSIRFRGRELVALGEREYRELRGAQLSLVPQDPLTALNPVLRIGDQVAEAVRAHDPTASTRYAAQRAAAMLERVGVVGGDSGNRARDYPHQLSGGMRQRVVLAMALINAPRLLIADEPTTALDATTQAEILALLDDLRRDGGLAVLFITHDLALVEGTSDRVVVMYAGRAAETAPTAAVFAEPRHPYTRGLLASSPQLGAARGELAVIPGQPPALGQVPSGCAFHPRCRFAEPRCAQEVPRAERVGDAHTVSCIRVNEIVADGSAL